MRSVLVSHPHGAAVASAVASAFERNGWLALYATGVGWAPGSVSAPLYESLSSWRPRLENRLAQGVRPGHLRSMALVEIGARLAGTVLREAGSQILSPYDALFVAHDAAVATMPWPRGVDMVYAPEDGALFTFERAARRGLGCTWELPTPHYLTQESMWRAEALRWHAGPATVERDWKKRRKDRELARATAIVVASAFTRSSLERIGVRVPILVVPYGFPVDRFTPKERAADGPFTVLSVGVQSLGKGTPYLLEAWKAAGLRDARLRLVGEMRNQEVLRRYHGLYEHVPPMPRALLHREYHAADLLAFPTLGDGFGLVIQEAMCCATPVVTTRCSGGPECITHGEDGWILPERDVDALAEFLRWGAAHRDRLRETGQRARRRAERSTWAEAGEALVGLLDRTARGPRPGPCLA